MWLWGLGCKGVPGTPTGFVSAEKPKTTVGVLVAGVATSLRSWEFPTAFS